MKNNSQLILTVVFVMGFLLLWDKLVVSRYAKPAPAISTTTAVETPPPPGGKGPSFSTPAGMAMKKGKERTSTTLKAPGVQVTIDSQGARATSWQIQERDHWIEFVPPNAKVLPLETFPELNFSVTK